MFHVCCDVLNFVVPFVFIEIEKVLPQLFAFFWFAVVANSGHSRIFWWFLCCVRGDHSISCDNIFDFVFAKYCGKIQNPFICYKTCSGPLPWWNKDSCVLIIINGSNSFMLHPATFWLDFASICWNFLRDFYVQCGYPYIGLFFSVVLKNVANMIWWHAVVFYQS